MTWQLRAAQLPEITRVDYLDSDCFSIALSNGHTILLELGKRIHEPAFAALIETRLFDRPQADGTRLYWVDGPEFTVAEILEMLAQNKE